MSYFNISTVKELVETHQLLTNCCLGCKEPISPLRIVANAIEREDNCESRGWCIFENADGRFGVMEDDEDYTGHG